MNETTFTSTAKQLKNGNIYYVVYADGAEIGSRTTAKTKGFKFAVVSQHNYTFAVKHAAENLAHQEKELVKYQGYVANPESALAVEKPGCHREQLAKWIADGTVAKWVTRTEQQVEKYKARSAALAGMTQDSPEFIAWHVYAFSNTGKETPKDWQHDMRFITLTQPTEQENLKAFRANQPHMTAEEAKAQRDMCNQSLAQPK